VFSRRKKEVMCELLAKNKICSKLRDYDGGLKCITYAPNIHVMAWIYRYKGVRVAMLISGFGGTSFYKLVSWPEEVFAKICCALGRSGKLERKGPWSLLIKKYKKGKYDYGEFTRTESSETAG